MRKAERVGDMAPMVIGVTFAPNREVAKPKPEWEQMLSAGCAAYGLQLAASAQGFDNVWSYGNVGQQPALARSFGCSDKDKIIGLMMIGSPVEEGGGAKKYRFGTIRNDLVNGLQYKQVSENRDQVFRRPLVLVKAK